MNFAELNQRLSDLTRLSSLSFFLPTEDSDLKPVGLNSLTSLRVEIVRVQPHMLTRLADTWDLPLLHKFDVVGHYFVKDHLQNSIITFCKVYGPQLIALQICDQWSSMYSDKWLSDVPGILRLCPILEHFVFPLYTLTDFPAISHPTIKRIDVWSSLKLQKVDHDRLRVRYLPSILENGGIDFESIPRPSLPAFTHPNGTLRERIPGIYSMGLDSISTVVVDLPQLEELRVFDFSLMLKLDLPFLISSDIEKDSMIPTRWSFPGIDIVSYTGVVSSLETVYWDKVESQLEGYSGFTLTYSARELEGSDVSTGEWENLVDGVTSDGDWCSSEGEKYLKSFFYGLFTHFPRVYL